MKLTNIKILSSLFLISALNLSPKNIASQSFESIDTIVVEEIIDSNIVDYDKIEPIDYLKDSLSYAIEDLKIKETELKRLLIILKDKKE